MLCAKKSRSQIEPPGYADKYAEILALLQERRSYVFGTVFPESYDPDSDRNTVRAAALQPLAGPQAELTDPSVFVSQLNPRRRD